MLLQHLRAPELHVLPAAGAAPVAAGGTGLRACGAALTMLAAAKTTRSRRENMIQRCEDSVGWLQGDCEELKNRNIQRPNIYTSEERRQRAMRTFDADVHVDLHPRTSKMQEAFSGDMLRASYEDHAGMLSGY